MIALKSSSQGEKGMISSSKAVSFSGNVRQAVAQDGGSADRGIRLLPVIFFRYK